VPPPEYFLNLRALLDRYQMLLIADEVQTGFGRTGKTFAVQNWNVQPDIITGGKALGGGNPIGYFSTTDEIAASYTRPGASTFGGNPVTAQAALKFLEILQRDKLAERAGNMGCLLKQKLDGIRKQYGLIADIRGVGLMIGAEVSDWNNISAAELTDTILEQMKDAGYLLGKTGPGRNVLTFMPPLIIGENDINEAVDVLDGILQKL
jgi:4-aminobutyrate aminotransferase/4-aminobutyrate aminotransferase/(S)-3-amino-2-methylpropionate transaminase